MRVLLLALAFFACAGPAAADRYILAYSGSGLGFVPLGDITVDTTINPRGYSADAHLRSGGLMNLFERTDLRAQSSGGVSPAGIVRWRRYDLDHHYSRKHRVIHMRAQPRGRLSVDIDPNFRLWGDPPASDAQKRISRDPLSTIVAMSVAVSRSQRCAGQYPTFDGRFHYMMSLSGGANRRYRGGGYSGPVLECNLTYAAVSGFEATDRGRRRVTQSHISFAMGDPTFAPPVRISTPLSAGGAVIRLTSWRRVVVQVGDEPTQAGAEEAPDQASPQTPTGASQ